MNDEPGRLFRAAWINGVHRHHPGEPNPSYTLSYDDAPAWERRACAEVWKIVAWLVHATMTSALTRKEKSVVIADLWRAEMQAAFDNPKPSYVAPWEELPTWQQEVDADIFEDIETHINGGAPTTRRQAP